MRKALLLLVAVLFAVAMPLHAQSGCVNSPEAPTAVLALMGGAGAFFVSAKARLKARKGQK